VATGSTTGTKLVLKFSAKAKRQLRRLRSVKLTLRVSGAASRTVTLKR
jgi:hypothetical protein